MNGSDHEERGATARLFSPDVLTGLMFIAFAALGFALSAELESGSAMAMGPGYFPRLLSGLLLLLGLAIAIPPLWKKRTGELPRGSLRPILMVSLSGLCFAALLQRGGIVLAVAATVLVGSLAAGRPRLFDVAALTLVLILASIALFVWAIGIPLPIWPSFGRS